jgi:hypothetical protein
MADDSNLGYGAASVKGDPFRTRLSTDQQITTSKELSRTSVRAIARTPRLRLAVWSTSRSDSWSPQLVRDRVRYISERDLRPSDLPSPRQAQPSRARRSRRSCDSPYSFTMRQPRSTRAEPDHHLDHQGDAYGESTVFGGRRIVRDCSTWTLADGILSNFHVGNASSNRLKC